MRQQMAYAGDKKTMNIVVTPAPDWAACGGRLGEDARLSLAVRAGSQDLRS